jgi:hypothetical protein
MDLPTVACTFIGGGPACLTGASRFAAPNVELGKNWLDESSGREVIAYELELSTRRFSSSCDFPRTGVFGLAGGPFAMARTGRKLPWHNRC